MPCPILAKLSHDLQPSDIMCVPGRIYCNTSASNVGAVRSDTSIMKHLPDPLSTPPKTQCPGSHCPRWYFGRKKFRIFLFYGASIYIGGPLFYSNKNDCLTLFSMAIICNAISPTVYTCSQE